MFYVAMSFWKKCHSFFFILFNKKKSLYASSYSYSVQCCLSKLSMKYPVIRTAQTVFIAFYFGWNNLPMFLMLFLTSRDSSVVKCLNLELEKGGEIFILFCSTNWLTNGLYYSCWAWRHVCAIQYTVSLNPFCPKSPKLKLRSRKMSCKVLHYS